MFNQFVSFKFLNELQKALIKYCTQNSPAPLLHRQKKIRCTYIKAQTSHLQMNQIVKNSKWELIYFNTNINYIFVDTDILAL